MKKIIKTVIYVVLINFSLLFSEEVTVQLKTIGRIFKSVTDTTSIGTAFVAGTKKSIFTCSHVVISDTLWFHGMQSDYKYRISAKYKLPNYDLAYLERTAGTQIESLEFGDFNKIQAGDKILYIAWDKLKNAFFVDFAIVSATGSALINFQNKVDFIEFEGAAIPGYSGGPVFNMDGKVIAMIREAWSKKGIRGGNEIQIIRAFSTDLLRILDSEIITVSNKINAIEMHSSLFELFSE